MKHRVPPKAPNAFLAGVFQRYDLFRGGGKRRSEDIGWKILNARCYYSGMKRKLIKTHKERWEQGFAAIS
jgi:hypothetical protein